MIMFGDVWQMTENDIEALESWIVQLKDRTYH